MNKPINICIVHYNTPKLTEFLIRSINKFSPNSKIYLFDNSDKFYFTYRQENLIYLDNTRGQIISFPEFFGQYPNRYGLYYSPRHAITVEKCIEIINEPFILLDSDTLLKRDISELVDENYAYIGEDQYSDDNHCSRVNPFICFINPALLKKYNVHYFDEHYIRDLNKYDLHGKNYDTGSTFSVFKDILPHKDIMCKYYIAHLGGASYRIDTKGIVKQWLTMYRNLFDGTDAEINEVAFFSKSVAASKIITPNSICIC